MKQEIFEIVSNAPLTSKVFKMTLAGNTDGVDTPGQFINIKLEGLFLRRPISVCNSENGILTIIYKVVGSGTEKMSKMQKGEKLDILLPLGNGFNTEKSGNAPLLIGGGVGVPPMYMLCRILTAQGKNVRVILGFNTADEVFYEDEFKALGADVTVTTADGTYGKKGFVTAAMDEKEYSYFYTCGPLPMLRAVSDASKTDGQLSFEEHMGCGFGACMGCTHKTKNGAKRICKDGPVLYKEEIEW